MFTFRQMVLVTKVLIGNDKKVFKCPQMGLCIEGTEYF